MWNGELKRGNKVSREDKNLVHNNVLRIVLKKTKRTAGTTSHREAKPSSFRPSITVTCNQSIVPREPFPGSPESSQFEVCGADCRQGFADDSKGSSRGFRCSIRQPDVWQIRR